MGCSLKHGAALGGRGRGSGGRGRGGGGGLLAGSEAVVALGHEPDNRVEDPGDNGDVGNLVVEGGGVSGGGGLERVELRENGHEHDHTKAPEVVLLLALEESANETRDNHEDVDTDEEVDIVGGGATEAEEVDELEGSGEEPVDVAAVEKFTAIEGTHVDTVAGGHGEVGEGGDHADEGGDDVVLALAIGDGLGDGGEVGGGHGHAGKASPDDFLSFSERDWASGSFD